MEEQVFNVKQNALSLNFMESRRHANQGASVPANPFLTDYIKKPLPPANENSRKGEKRGIQEFSHGDHIFLMARVRVTSVSGGATVIDFVVVTNKSQE